MPRGQCQLCSGRVSQELCRAQVPSFLLCLPLPAHGARASLATPSPATPGDICACCCDTGGETEPPAHPLGWTDAAAAGITDTGKDECPRRPGLAGGGAGALARTKPQALGASLPARTPQPCSAWGSAPPDHHSHTASPRWLCMAWGRVRTLSLPLDLSSHSGRPCSLSDPVWGQTLLLRGALVAPLPHPSLHGLAPALRALPPLPGTHGGNFSEFLK